MHDRSRMTILALGALALLSGGCVKRVLSIQTAPPGALVWLNDREIGRTPVDVQFVHYGTYDVRIEHRGYEPLSTSAKVSAPWWDLPGPDFFAELVPAEIRSENEFLFVLEPRRDDPDELEERARGVRAGVMAEIEGE